MPESAKKCVDSWHEFMPDYEYKLWNEDNFDVNAVPYTKEAYEAKKYAFVSDFVRLWALNNEGGIYLDTDVEVFKSFDDLLCFDAFVGFEGSKRLPVGTCVMASKANGLWVRELLEAYHDRHFIKDDGSYDFTTNVQFITAMMCEQGFEPKDDDSFIPEEYVEDEAKRRIIMDLIQNTLSDVQRQSIIMYYYDEMSLEEISEVMGCPLKTVSSRLVSAREKLREAVLIYEKKNNDNIALKRFCEKLLQAELTSFNTV